MYTENYVGPPVAYLGSAKRMMRQEKDHWTKHKKDCKSPYMKNSWMPMWHTQGRDPAFIRDGPPVVSFGGVKYFWGNTPGLDILCLKENEGETYGEDLHILFAASGDMRNLAMTIARLPPDYQKTVNVTLNDWDLDVVARNTIMLLIALAVNDAEKATDCMLLTMGQELSIRQAK